MLQHQYRRCFERFFCFEVPPAFFCSTACWRVPVYCQRETKIAQLEAELAQEHVKSDSLKLKRTKSSEDRESSVRAPQSCCCRISLFSFFFRPTDSLLIVVLVTLLCVLLDSQESRNFKLARLSKLKLDLTQVQSDLSTFAEVDPERVDDLSASQWSCWTVFLLVAEIAALVCQLLISAFVDFISCAVFCIQSRDCAKWSSMRIAGQV